MAFSRVEWMGEVETIELFRMRVRNDWVGGTILVAKAIYHATDRGIQRKVPIDTIKKLLAKGYEGLIETAEENGFLEDKGRYSKVGRTPIWIIGSGNESNFGNSVVEEIIDNPSARFYNCDADIDDNKAYGICGHFHYDWEPKDAEMIFTICTEMVKEKNKDFYVHQGDVILNYANVVTKEKNIEENKDKEIKGTKEETRVDKSSKKEERDIELE